MSEEIPPNEIAEIADTCDNIAAASRLPMPERLHVELMRNSVERMSARLKSLYIVATGENPWKGAK